MKTENGPGAQFSPASERILRQAGWFPERTVDDDIMQNWYVIQWLSTPSPIITTIFPSAFRFLREFGGLKCMVDETIGYRGLSFCIDPIATRDSGIWDYNWLFDEWSVGGPLFPLGYQGDFDSAIAINVAGKIFVLADSPILIGVDPIEALQNLLIGKRVDEEYSFNATDGGGKVVTYLMEKMTEIKF